MGLFGELGKLAGTIVGGVVGGATELVGEVVDSDFIQGHWRDGDGNTDIDLTEAQGGGYIKSNTDGSTLNNLG